MRRLVLKIGKAIEERYGIPPEFPELYAILEVFMKNNPGVDPETLDWASYWNPHLLLEQILEKLKKKYPRYIWPDVRGGYIREVKVEPGPWIELLLEEPVERESLEECPLCRLAPLGIQHSEKLDRTGQRGFQKNRKKWYLYDWDDIIDACIAKQNSSRGVKKTFFTLLRLYVKSLKISWMVLCFILFILLFPILYSRD